MCHIWSVISGFLLFSSRCFIRFFSEFTCCFTLRIRPGSVAPVFILTTVTTLECFLLVCFSPCAGGVAMSTHPLPTHGGVMERAASRPSPDGVIEHGHIFKRILFWMHMTAVIFFPSFFLPCFRLLALQQQVVFWSSCMVTLTINK